MLDKCLRRGLRGEMRGALLMLVRFGRVGMMVREGKGGKQLLEQDLWEPGPLMRERVAAFK
jgi:hypothetical protein